MKLSFLKEWVEGVRGLESSYFSGRFSFNHGEGNKPLQHSSQSVVVHLLIALKKKVRTKLNEGKKKHVAAR